MKTKHIVILLVVLVVLGLLTWCTRSREDAGWREEDVAQTILPEDFDTEAVKAIAVTKNGQKLNFRRTEQGWVLAERGDYPVDVSQLGKIVLDLINTKIAQRYQAEDDEMKAMELGADAVELELLDSAGKTLAKLRFGKRVEKEADQVTMAALYGQASGTPLGRYVQLQDENAALVANTFSILDNTPGQWLDQEFLNIDKLKSLALSEKGKQLWKVERKDEKEQLAIVGDFPKGYQPDTNVIAAIDRAFSWLTFKDVAPASQQFTASRTLNITDISGATYVIDFGERLPEGRYMRVKASYSGEDKTKAEKMDKLKALLEKYNYLVIPNTFDAVDKTLVQLCKVAEKQEEKKDAAK